MLGQASNLQVETDEPTATHDVSSSKTSWLLMMGFGFGCFALGVASACLMLPSASQEPAHHVGFVQTPSSFLPLTSRTSIVTNLQSLPRAVGLTPRSRAVSPVFMQMAPTPTKTRQKVAAKPKTASPKPKTAPPKLQVAKPQLKGSTELLPMWKVMLLGDEEYEHDAVIAVLQQVIPDIANERDAKEKFDVAQSAGRSLLLVVNKELAEAYAEQLARCDPAMIVFAEIEEDK
jgi:ATP-dependent Clp protease adapter protein ClpS